MVSLSDDFAWLELTLSGYLNLVFGRVEIDRIIAGVGPVAVERYFRETRGDVVADQWFTWWHLGGRGTYE